MSCLQLPAELLDLIVDLLHDTRCALMNCCLVSTSWIPRSRKHLFATITFHTEERLQSWKKAFPNPSTSPAHYTETLFVECSLVVTAADAEAGGWVTAFSHVVNLEVSGRELPTRRLAVNLAALHGLSPVVKSLRMNITHITSSQVFDLILSFPLLESLALVAHQEPFTDNGDGSDGRESVARPSSSHMFTGSLEILPWGGMKPITHRLLSLPSGIHFRRLSVTWNREEDILLTTALVEGCSHTLESLKITCYCEPILASINLSKATRLRDAGFRVELVNVEWITKALQTITPGHLDLRQISIDLPYYPLPIDKSLNIKLAIGETVSGQWLDLDCLLVRLCESRSIRLGVVCTTLNEERRGMGYLVEGLLPETTRRGVFDLVE